MTVGSDVNFTFSRIHYIVIIITFCVVVTLVAMTVTMF